MKLPKDTITLEPGSYYIGDLHALTIDHGMFDSAQSRIEMKVQSHPGHFIADIYNEHLLVAFSFPLQPHLVQQHLVSNVGEEITFARHTPFEPRKTGTLAIINLASLGANADAIPPDFPAIVMAFEQGAVADHDGHRLKVGTVEIYTQTTITK